MHSFPPVLLTVIAPLVIAAGFQSAAPRAREAVEIRLPGRYFVEPATVHIDVALTPNGENRVLRIEADGEQFFRAAELPLEGARAPKFHTVWFKNLPGGHYIVRASVLSSADTLAGAEVKLVVMAPG